MLCLHEGCHLLYARDCGFEPRLYGPSSAKFYTSGVGWQTTLGAVEGLPERIRLIVDPLLVGKFYLGPAFSEEKLLGEEYRKQMWKKGASGDLSDYCRWSIKRHERMRDKPPFLLDRIRESVHHDLEQPAFRERLLSAAREYETFLKQDAARRERWAEARRAYLSPSS